MRKFLPFVNTLSSWWDHAQGINLLVLVCSFLLGWLNTTQTAFLTGIHLLNAWLFPYKHNTSTIQCNEALSPSTDVQDCIILISALTEELLSSNTDHDNGYKLSIIKKNTENLVQLLSKPSDSKWLNNRELTDHQTANATAFSEQTDFSTREQPFMHRCKDIVEAHLDDPTFGVDHFATILAMSKPVLYKKLKLCSGLSVNNFIKLIRLNKAMMLIDTVAEHNISGIAYMVGFSDPKYFSREFKKKFGHPPRHFRK